MSESRVISEVIARDESVDLLVFEVNGSIYGADASQVARISARSECGTASSSFGAPDRGTERALVVNTDMGEQYVAVDEVRGVRSVPVDALRRIPPVAASARFAIGFWLDGNRSILLVDLVEMLEASGRQ